MSLDLEYDPARLPLLHDGALAVVERTTLIRVEGPGALACLQGLLTSDLESPGEGSLSYGAVLTPRGMIVADLWVFREADGFSLVADPEAREPLGALLRRSLPPRLARAIDRSDDSMVLWCLGARSRGTGGSVLGVGNLEPGRMLRRGEVAIGAGGTSAPFTLIGAGPASPIEEIGASLRRAGMVPGNAGDLLAARVLAGWPTLGREIDEKTLPQEVRFEELGGVSFTKGCYTGQETVARVHFRGHVNRTLRGVAVAGGTAPADRTISSGGRDVGSLRTALGLGRRLLGLAMVRRETPDGSAIVVGGREGRILPLPLGGEAFRP